MSNKHLQVIVGLGVTGLSCARFLKSRGQAFAMVDSRANPPQLAAFKEAYPDVTVSVGSLEVPLLEQAETIILSPGIAMTEPAIAKALKRGARVIGDIELFAEAVKAPVVAITGTNAKSTVTTLVGLMCEAAGHKVGVGGNLGVPALDLLASHPDAEFYVLELSSFQLETTYSLKPAVATVLNITPDHMDRYADLAAYQAAKHRVYRHCRAAVCNLDDPLTESDDPSVQQKFYFTLSEPKQRAFGLSNIDGQTFLAYESQRLMPVSELPVMGKHYQANALASLAIGHALGLPFEPMLRVLKTFNGLPHRCQFVRERQGVRWYNDSKGTNVGATQAAIEGLGSEINGKLVLIAGGLGKSADFSPLLPVMQKFVRHTVLIGQAAKELAALIEGRLPLSFAASMDEAVQQSSVYAHEGDCVLLSPACASYDMFNNFEHRGKVFVEIVQQLKD